jgi:PhnB protein
MPVKALKPVPEGMNTVTTHLLFNGNCRQAIGFYKKTFDATLIGDIMDGPGGKTVMHALMKFGDTYLMMGDAMPGSGQKGPIDYATASFFMYVNDCDAVYNKALSEGCTVVYPMMDTFWGDRLGNIKDPFGHVWGIASHQWELTPEEMAGGQEEWMKGMR